MFAWTRSLPVGIFLALWGGCACRQHCQSVGTYTGKSEQQFECRRIEPQAIVADISRVPADLKPEKEPAYCVLSEMEAQCLAVRNSNLANLLAKEAEAVRQQSSDRSGSNLASELLCLASRHRRNVDASAALQVLLKLVEAEGGSQNLNLRLDEVQGMEATVKSLEAAGLLSPVSDTELSGQRLDLLHRQVELQNTIKRLNHELALLIGTPLPPDTRYWPEVELKIDPDLPDRDEAVAAAVSMRSDLAAWNMATQADSGDSLPAVRMLLQSVGTGLGNANTPNRLALLFRNLSQHGESQVRSEQLSLGLTDTRYAARDQTLQAIDLMQTRLSQIGLTRQRLELALTRLKSGEQQQQLTAAPLNTRKLKLDVLAIEQDLLHDVIEWKIATVKLKEAQGLLEIECCSGG